MTQLLLLIINSIKRFFIGTFRGIRWFLIQMLVWIFIAMPFSMLGIGEHGGRSGAILAFSLFICIFAYSMIFNWYYAFVSLRRFLNTFWIPYIVYACAVFFGILAELDWDIRTVSIDQYMLLGWFMPLYGAFIIHNMRKIKKRLRKDKRKLRAITISFEIIVWTFGLFLFLISSIVLIIHLSANNIIDDKYGELICNILKRRLHIK